MYHSEVLTELKNLNVYVLYSNKAIKPFSTLFSVCFPAQETLLFLPLYQKRKQIWIHYFLATQEACLSPAAAWKQICAIVPAAAGRVVRADGKKTGARKCPRRGSAPSAPCSCALPRSSGAPGVWIETYPHHPPTKPHALELGLISITYLWCHLSCTAIAVPAYLLSNTQGNGQITKWQVWQSDRHFNIDFAHLADLSHVNNAVFL